MITKFIKKQAQKAAVLSFKKEILDETAVKKFVREFKKLPLNQAIMSMGFYLKALKEQISKHILIIESAYKLSGEEVKSVTRALSEEFKVLQIQTKLSPSLLGGFKVKIADTVLDLSLKEKISQIKYALTN